MPDDFTQLTDLAAQRIGGEALIANDEFFAPKDNLLKPEAPVFLEHEYTDRGKWMDGWESRRKRPPITGPDWCIIRLGLPGLIRGVNVDTAFFKGNYPSHCSIDAADIELPRNAHELADGAAANPVVWREVLPRSALKGDSPNLFGVDAPFRATHVRLNIYPDGGVARLRVHGDVMPDWARIVRPGELVDLAAIENAGLAVICSDMFFGVRHNLLMPGRAKNMGDGWETRRRRDHGQGLGHDWVIVRLGRRGVIRRIEIDTNHFKGNYPDSCDIQGLDAGSASLSGEQLAATTQGWTTLLPVCKLRPSDRHYFQSEVSCPRPITHVRLNIHPDGGVSRLRLWGEVA